MFEALRSFAALRTHASSRLVLAGVIAIAGMSPFAAPAAADDGRPLPVAPQAAPRTAPDLPTDQLIVGFKEKAGPAQRNASYGRLAKDLGMSVQDVRGTAGGARVVRADRNLTPAEADRALETLRADPDVDFAEPDTRMFPMADPDDPFYPLQWDMWEEPGGIRLPAAWPVSKGAGIVVAVVDTGITSHSDLNANVLPGYDMISKASAARDSDGRDANPRDEGDWTSDGLCGAGTTGDPSSWHGTHVAGTVAAVANNGRGVAGVAPDAKILPVRALGACGGYTTDIADSIIWAAGGNVAGAPANTNRAKVINLSLGGITPCSATYQNAIDYAYKAGAAVVVAAGNANRPAADSSPANCRNVITVAASTRSGSRAPYSNYGDAVDLTAPGGDFSQTAQDGIASTLNSGTYGPAGENYVYSQGTSMAAPHVAGAAALVMSASGRTASPATVEQRLKDTARALPGTCPGGCGAGLLDAGKALGVSTSTVVTPSAVLFTDRDGTANDSYTVPVSEGVDYLVGGTVVKAGTYPGSGTVTVTARAKPGYVLAAGATAQWTLAFKGALEPAVPTISGAPAVGSTLTAVPGTWTPAPDSLAYQWYRSGTAIAGATSAGYRLTDADLETTISVRVTGTASGYGTATAESAGISVVPGPVFADVGPETVFFSEINWMAAAGISRGWAEADGTRTYRPAQPVNRDQMAAFLYRLAGSPDFVPPAESPFTDVSTQHAFYKEIAWLSAAGISRGWTEADGGRTFRPAEPVLRDQMAAFLYRHAGSPDFVPLAQPPFADVAPGHPFYREISWVWKTGISRGWSEGDGTQTFRPSVSILRDQMAAFMYRYATRS
ncbi:S8 family serine peptidase [Arthrobacter oryzae]|uniref:S8 family serine peptidase n=1 Tax=Arthrobacter oryzae TaxID=409290 RepID=UPI00273C29CE|nr:S8 family serine peptidase [Arthrobacter oryzae]WLQ07102.1 S8 family serine peptidase [Arthrobacter oryzae]